MIDISKFNKADVLAALYNNAKPKGMGFLHFTPELMTAAEAQSLLDEGRTYFDYLKGRVIKVNLGGQEFDPRLYDRDNGNEAALRALEDIK